MAADSALANNNNDIDFDFDDEETPDLVDTQASTLATTAAATVGKGARSDSQLDKMNPITIITGFLGAGKSALLDYILTESTTLRWQ
ncbi:hypothetical protein BGX31_004610 [Mortierella sp. GBA43]|nr:hypothetical protein BGX31_004610 [Mortierella sp. GBA43]